MGWREKNKNSGELLLFVVFLTLTDPLRIQPWSQDRRNQIKPNRESEISRKSRHKRTDKNIPSQARRFLLLITPHKEMCEYVCSSHLE